MSERGAQLLNAAVLEAFHQLRTGSGLNCVYRRDCKRNQPTERTTMDWKLELVAVPVSDVDRAKAFYTEKAGFNADVDAVVSDDVRFIQLTPPGSACSTAI